MAMAIPLLTTIGSSLATSGAAAASAVAGSGIGIGSAISAAATGLGALSSFQASRGQAKTMGHEAQARRRAAAMDAAQQRRRNRVAAARGRAVAGEAGVAGGSTWNLLKENVFNMGVDVATSQNNTNLTADNLAAQAAGIRQQAPFGLAGGILSAAGTLADPLNFGLED